MLRRMVVTAAVVLVCVLALAPRDMSQVADIEGAEPFHASDGYLWYGDCTFVQNLSFSGQGRVEGPSGRFTLRWLIRMVPRDGSEPYQWTPGQMVLTTGNTESQHVYSFNHDLQVNTLNEAAQCALQFYRDGGNTMATMSWLNVVIHTSDGQVTGPGGSAPPSMAPPSGALGPCVSPPPSLAPSQSPSPCASPSSAPPTPHLCEGHGTWTNGGGLVLTSSVGVKPVTITGGRARCTVGTMAMSDNTTFSFAIDGHGYAASISVTWGGYVPTGGGSTGVGANDGTGCWNARSSSGSTGAVTSGSGPLIFEGYVNVAGSGFGCAADFTETWHLYMDWSPGVPSSPTPSPPPSVPPSSDPFLPSSGVPSATPVPPYAGGPNPGTNTDQCDKHPATVGCIPVQTATPNTGGQPPLSSPLNLSPCESQDPTTKAGYMPTPGATGWVADNQLDNIGKSITIGIPWHVGHAISGTWNAVDNAVVPQGECIVDIVASVPERLSSYAPIGYVFQAADQITGMLDGVAGADYAPCADFQLGGAPVEMCIPDLSEAPGVSAVRSLLLVGLALYALLVLWGLGAAAIGAPSPDPD